MQFFLAGVGGGGGAEGVGPGTWTPFWMRRELFNGEVAELKRTHHVTHSA